MPKIVDHEKYREEILESCFDQFTDRGFHSLSMREIAQKLDISTGTLYHYFPNKDSIFQQMIRHLSKKQVRTFRENLQKTKNKEDRIQSMFNYISTNRFFFQKVLFLIIDYFRHNGNSDPEGFIKETLDYYKESINETLGIGNDVVSGTILSINLGLVLQSTILPSSESLENQVSILGIILNGILSENLRVA